MVYPRWMALDLLEIARRQLTLRTHRLHSLPVVVLMPHSRCNCRCVMCDIWKGNRDRQELGRDELTPHVEAFRRLRVRWVVLSGGEALMHSNLWALCELLAEIGVKITLLSTGLLLRRWASEVVRWCDEVIVSLDGSREVHDAIRRIPRAFDQLADGVTALRQVEPDYRVTARCVLQRENYRDLPNIIRAGREIGLDSLSFLAADVSSEAFNRPDGWDGDRAGEVALSPEEATDFARLLEQVIAEHETDFTSGFVVESPEKLRRLAQYYLALHGQGELPGAVCNAPWVSAVIEADGSVRPCFFHPAQGNLQDRPLEQILNSAEAIDFRRQLDIERDPICRRCVCTLNLGPLETF
ncbi:MAG: radical SAM protein [Acidobacteriota bacterium]